MAPGFIRMAQDGIRIAPGCIKDGPKVAQDASFLVCWVKMLPGDPGGVMGVMGVLGLWGYGVMGALGALGVMWLWASWGASQPP